MDAMGGGSAILYSTRRKEGTIGGWALFSEERYSIAVSALVCMAHSHET